VIESIDTFQFHYGGFGTMKRIFFGAVLCLFITGLSLTHAEYLEKRTCNVTKANVRNGSGARYSVVEELAQGDTFEVLQESSGWLQIKTSKGTLGWISKGLTAESLLEKRKCARDNINVRSGPGTGNGIIGTLTQGQELEVYAIKDNWLKISLPDGFGWVSADYTQLIPESTASPADSQLGVFIVIGIAVFLLVFSYMWDARNKRCPKCGKWRAERIIGKEEIGREGEYQNERFDQTIRDANNQKVATVSRVEPVHYTTVTYNTQYQCKYCKHEWTGVTERTFRG
jgi:uncharacterized protein YraI